MTELTPQDAIRLHRKKWNWIADETEKQQRIVRGTEYFKACVPDTNEWPHIISYCCEYDKQRNAIGRKTCKHCPIQWPQTITSRKSCPCLNSLYHEWTVTRSWKQAAQLARKIANLPEKGA